MRVVEGLDAYRALVRENKARLGKVVTNCRLMSSAFAEPAAVGRLYYESLDNGLIVLVDEDDYLNTYYYLQEGASIPQLFSNRKLLSEEAVKAGSRPCGVLDSSGFAYVRRNLQFAVRLDEGDSFGLDDCKASQDELRRLGYSLVPCTDEALAQDVVLLWLSELGGYDVPATHRDFLAQGDTVMCALDAAGKLAGAYWWHDAGRTRNARHVVVGPAHRRKGIARALMQSCLCDARQTGILRVLTWISNTNDASIALHKSVGYARTGQEYWQYERDERCNHG